MNSLQEVFRILLSLTALGETKYSRIMQTFGLTPRRTDETEFMHIYRSLKRLLFVGTVFPGLLLIISIASGKGWMVMTVGIFWLACAAYSSTLMAPVGVGVTIQTLGRKYIDVVMLFFYFIGTFSLILGDLEYIIDLKNHPQLIPAMALSSLVLVIICYRRASTKWFETSMLWLAIATLTISLGVAIFSEWKDDGRLDTVTEWFSSEGTPSRTTAALPPTDHPEEKLECGGGASTVVKRFGPLAPTQCSTRYTVRGARDFRPAELSGQALVRMLYGDKVAYSYAYIPGQALPEPRVKFVTLQVCAIEGNLSGAVRATC